MRWPYLTFIFLTLITFGYIYGLNEYQDYETRTSGQNWDFTTNTWKKDYDWQASNRQTDFLDRLRFVFMGALLAHSFVNCFYSTHCAFKDRRHLIALVIFIIITLFLSLLWLAASIPTASMIG